MPAGVIKRGRAGGRSLRNTPTPIAASLSTSKNINSFAKVSKGNHSQLLESKKRGEKLIVAIQAALPSTATTTTTTIPTITTTTATTPLKSTRPSSAAVTPTLNVVPPTPVVETPRLSTRKRKAEVNPPSNESDADLSDDDAVSTPSKKKSSPVKTPSSKRLRRSAAGASSPSPSQQAPTPKGRKTRSSLLSQPPTSAELDLSTVVSRLRLEGTGADSYASSVAESSGYSTAGTSHHEDEDDGELPQDLQDMASLFAAFLKTVALHATYAGVGTKIIDTRALLPDVSRTWGKRTVTVDDLRLLIGILDRQSSGATPKKPASTTASAAGIFKLSDHGRKQVLLEIISPNTTILANPVPVQTAFTATIQRLWQSQHHNFFDTTAFIASLPRANVTKKPVSRRIDAGKGQQTLEAFKKSVQEKKDRDAELAAARAAAVATPKLLPGEKKKKLSVLDRIKLKSAASAELAASAPPPSPVVLARRRALHRAEDVADVLIMLCTSNATSSLGGNMARVSFPLQEVVERVKDSLRISIEAGEAGEVVRLIAGEVAPEWVKVVRIGGRGEFVVMSRGHCPGKGEVGSRVGVAMGT